MSNTFEDFAAKVKGRPEAPERLLCLDPGEDTGWAVFHKEGLYQCGQARTFNKENKLPSWEKIDEVFRIANPTAVVCENYRVYQHKLKQHANAEIFTLRLIGVIDYLCWKAKIPITYQMAAMAKGFSTDAKLKSWGYWETGQRHARDAIRHGCYFILFNGRRLPKK